MRTSYVIKEQVENEEIRNTYKHATTKREIESKFNKMMRWFKKDGHYCVEHLNMGHARVTFFGEFGMVETEYWIARD